MGEIVVTGATLLCTFGAAPSCLNVTSQSVNLADGKPVATIQDCQGNTNIPPFGMCSSPANPQVAAATAAALGVLTPQPCSMAPAGIWSASAPGLLAGGKPVLMSDAVLSCITGAGSISVTFAGQVKAGL